MFDQDVCGQKVCCHPMASPVQMEFSAAAAGTLARGDPESAFNRHTPQGWGL